jgi:cyclic pyranopterin phosphate synthase
MIDRATSPRDRLGRVLRDLRISVTDRCNFRCGYCMPAEIYGERYQFLPKPQILSFEEIERLARLFAGLGVRKLRITGGEPLVRAQLPALVERLARIEGIDDLALTTNGYLLAEQVEALRKAGLHRLTISLDSLDPRTFERMNGRGLSIEPVLAGIAAAERAGFAPLKFNCVVQRGHNEQQIGELARRFRGTGHIVRFIEYMDVGTLNGWRREDVVPAAEILARLAQAVEVPLVPIEPNYGGEVAQRYAYADGSGEIGIIASISQPFCGDCTRARLSADGHLFTCLFARSGTDLKTPLRAGASDRELCERIAGIWSRRSDRYSELRAIESRRSDAPERVEMYRIGG